LKNVKKKLCFNLQIDLVKKKHQGSCEDGASGGFQAVRKKLETPVGYQ
jgi:hypothetical protein